MNKLSASKALTNMSNYERIKRPVYVVSIEEKLNKAGKMQVNVSVKDGVSLEQIAIFDSDIQSLTSRYPFFKTEAVVNLTITKKDPYYNAENVIEENTEEFDLDEIADKAVDNPLPYYNYILKMVDEASAERKDDLDAKHYEAREEIMTLEPGAVSSKKVYALDTRLYRRTDQQFKGKASDKSDEQ